MSVYRNPYDWCEYSVPENIRFGANCFVETAYCFRRFYSRREYGLIMGESAMICDGTDLIIGEEGCLELGDYAMLTSVHIRCERSIVIGNRVMVSWNVGIFDTDIVPPTVAGRTAALQQAQSDAYARLPAPPPRPVRIDDDAWIGFGAIILPGVHIGARSIIGAKSVVTEDIPPDVIAAGNPARIIRYSPSPPQPPVIFNFGI